MTLKEILDKKSTDAQSAQEKHEEQKKQQRDQNNEKLASRIWSDIEGFFNSLSAKELLREISLQVRYCDGGIYIYKLNKHYHEYDIDYLTVMKVVIDKVEENGLTVDSSHDAYCTDWYVKYTPPV